MKISAVKEICLKSNTDKQIDFIGVVFWIIITSSIPLFSGAIGLLEFTYYSFYIITSYLTGIILLHKIRIIEEMPRFLITGIQVFFGFTLQAILFIFTKDSSYFWIIFFLLIIIFSHPWNSLNSQKYNFYEIAIALPIFIITIAPNEISLSTKLFYGVSWDFSYYTAIVESLKTNQDFFNSIFQNGVAINYPALSLIIPANLASFSGMPSQIALWGIFMPFLYIISLYTTGWLIYKLYLKIFNRDESHNIKRLGLIIILLLFWGPPHILNILKINLKEGLFLGPGYLIPGGSPGYTISLFLGSLTLLIYLFTEKKTWKDSALIILSIIIMGGSKIAFALPFISFIGILGIIEAIEKKTLKDLLTLAVGSLLSVITMYLFFYSSETNSINYFSFDGSNIFVLIDLAKKYKLHSTPIFFTICIAFLIKLFFFIGLKIATIRTPFSQSQNKAFLRDIIISITCTFLFFSTIYLFYNSKHLDLDGSIYTDASFDTEQFIRSTIYIFNIFAIPLVLYFFEINDKTWKTIIQIWIFICAYSFIWQNIVNLQPNKSFDDKWHLEVVNDFKKIKPKNMIMYNPLSRSRYSGLGLTSIGVHPWYIFGSTKYRGVFSWDIETQKRRMQLENFFNPRLSKKSRVFAANYFIEHHVDCLIKNPDSQANFKIAIEDSLIQKIPNTKHMYEFKIK